MSNQNISIIKNVYQSESVEWIWINSEYLKCLRTSLPCNCDDEELLVAYFNKNDSTKFTIEVNNRDNYSFDNLSKIGNNRFERSNDSSFVVKVHLDTLFILTPWGKARFEKYPKRRISGYDNILGKVNVLLLSDLLKKSGFDLINKLELSEDYVLYCNKDLGNINLISKPYGSDNEWIIEMKDSCVYIYKYMDSQKSKSRTPIIIKELEYVIKING